MIQNVPYKVIFILILSTLTRLSDAYTPVLPRISKLSSTKPDLLKENVARGRSSLLQSHQSENNVVNRHDQTSQLKKMILSSFLALSMNLPDSSISSLHTAPAYAAVSYDQPSAAANMNLETAIQNLETSKTRADVVQSMADLYESAGTRTLLARSKYKYVRMSFH